MDNFIKKFTINTFCLMSFLLLFSLFNSENTFSRQNWNGDYTKVTYNANENSITFRFEVFDYCYALFSVNAYLRWCDFFYTTEAGGINNYTHLMRAETKDQGAENWTWLKMRYKKTGTQIQLLDCYKPANGTMWPDTNDDVTVEVKNYVNDIDHRLPNDNFGGDHYVAFFTVKWFLGEEYKNVKRIRLNGFWKVNGPFKGDNITNVYYDVPSASMLKSTELKASPSDVKPESTAVSIVKVATEGNAVVIKGACLGENIKIYTTKGAEIKSFVTNNDVVKVNLPVNKVYIVNVGQARYKVAL